MSDERTERLRDINDKVPTLRDQFAMSVLQGMAQHEKWVARSKTMASIAYHIADAMLEERSREPEQ